MLPYIITILIIVAISGSLISGIWKVSHYLVYPIQIILFLILIGVCVKAFFKWENAENLHKEVEKSGVAEVQQKILETGISEARKKAASRSEEEPQEGSNTNIESRKQVQTTAPSAPSSKKKQVDVLDYM